MKIEKAIEVLKMENELMQFDPNTGEDYPIELQNQDNQDLYKANLIAIEALEKQIAIQVNCIDSVEMAWLDGYCICGEYVTDSMDYCRKCGQKLDWSEVEYED